MTKLLRCAELEKEKTASLAREEPYNAVEGCRKNQLYFNEMGHAQRVVSGQDYSKTEVSMQWFWKCAVCYGGARNVRIQRKNENVGSLKLALFGAAANGVSR